MSDLLKWTVWPLIVALPLTLTAGDLYKKIFPAEWYDKTARDFWYDSEGVWPSPLGLSLGIGAVVVGQFFMLVYFICYAREKGLENQVLIDNKKKSGEKPEEAYRSFTAIQKVGARAYELQEGLMTHLAQPEGFVMLGSYLIGTWMLGLMPASYYAFDGGISWGQVAQCLLLQDLIQYMMHGIEHYIKEVPFNLYAISHKPHHRFTNPRLFDAFNGSATDTFLMILVPLALTARLVHCNVWSYMAFGSLYANWLTLIHAEYSHPWDPLFRKLGLGTAADHHVHHKLFKFNYGHTFMYWDRLFGTYMDPAQVGHFNKGV